MANVFYIAVVVCSTRSTRLNPFIAEYVRGLADVGRSDCILEILDIKDQALPLFDEPTIPRLHPADNPTPHYEQEHTRNWSKVVRDCNAFIFVTPQYNWSIPASLKNAIDYLYHEWCSKPAGIVTYGGHGGGKASKHLRQILSSVKMKVAESAPQLVCSSKTLPYCTDNDEINAEDKDRWRAAGVEDALRATVMEILQELEAK